VQLMDTGGVDMTGFSSGGRRSAGVRAASLRGLATLALAIGLAGCGGGDGGGGGADAVAAGIAHACALEGGVASCWGLNTLGRLGDGTTDNRDRAVRVRGLGGARAIAAGSSHSCAVVSDGVRCWGDNRSSRLGSAAFVDSYSATPVRVDGLSTGVRGLTLGLAHSCALIDGAVKCWGDNASRQLGAATGSASATPLQVPGLETGVVAISAGEAHTCAVLNGGVRCWGGGSGGVLGDGNAAVHSRSTPYQTIPEESGVTAIASSSQTTCALAGAQVRCWGHAFPGMTGAGCTNGVCPTPIDVVGAPTGTTSLAVGDANLYLLVNGGVKAMGGDASGELGNGEPTTDSTTLVNVTGLANGVSAVSSVSSFACALLDGGAVWCWGGNLEGQLGDESTTNRPAPVAVHGL